MQQFATCDAIYGHNLDTHKLCSRWRTSLKDEQLQVATVEEQSERQIDIL